MGDDLGGGERVAKQLHERLGRFKNDLQAHIENARDEADELEDIAHSAPAFVDEERFAGGRGAVPEGLWESGFAGELAFVPVDPFEFLPAFGPSAEGEEEHAVFGVGHFEFSVDGMAIGFQGLLGLAI